MVALRNCSAIVYHDYDGVLARRMAMLMTMVIIMMTAMLMATMMTAA